MQGAYPMLKCEEDFGLGRTAFERIISGFKRAGGHEYKRCRAMGSDEKPTSMTRQTGKSRTPWTKDQQVWYLVWSTSVSFVKRRVHWNPV